MPTPEEIKKIARKYAESKSSIQEFLRAYDKRDNLNDAYCKEALAVLEWLSKDYIVPKSKVKDEYEFAMLSQHSNHTADQDYGSARKTLLEFIFGKKLFNEEKL